MADDMDFCIAVRAHGPRLGLSAARKLHAGPRLGELAPQTPKSKGPVLEAGKSAPAAALTDSDCGV